MKSFYVAVIICMLGITQAFAQSIINGKVTDMEKNPLEYVTVALYDANTRALQQGTITNRSGIFSLEKVKPGKYYLTLTMIGFVKIDSEPVTIGTNQTYTIPDFVLYEDVQNMQEVVVVAKKNFVEQQADKMVINPEASIATASDDLLEVLRKSPGIIIDNSDNITLKNKQVKVMIDNRPTYVSGEQLAAMLRNMQATSIDRIEIIENPPSRYDAEGDAGIINIRTKRGLMRGYNGSLTLGGGLGKRFSDNYGLDLNYRNEKWNIYGNYYGGDRRGWYEIDLTRYFYQLDGSIYKQYNEQYSRSSYGNTKLGVDYYITPKQIIGVMTRGNFGKNTSSMDGDADITGMAGEPIQHSQTESDADNNYKNVLVNLNYKWVIDSLGQELSIDADMAIYRSNGTNDVNTTYSPPEDPLNMYKEEGGKSDFYSIKADYVLPIGKKGRIESGLKSSWANIDGDLGILKQDGNGNWADPDQLSSHYIYSENINAAYLSGRYSLSEKTIFQLGLRGEHTTATGDNRTLDEAHTQKYFNLFPSFFFQQKLEGNHQVGLSYSYRIGRPPYDYLNPFVFLIDPYTFSQGNPYLSPQYTHASKLSYTFKNKYILSLDFSYTEDVCIRYFKQNDQSRRVIATWGNLNDYYNASATFVIPIQIAKWWNTNTSVIGLYGQYKSPGEGTEINKSQYTVRGNTTFTFILPKSFSIELSGWYIGKAVYGVINAYPESAVNMGVQKLFAKSRASLKLSVSDIFNTHESKYTQYNNVAFNGRERGDTRRINLTFTYRFGRNDIKAARQRSTGLEEETSRAK